MPLSSFGAAAGSRDRQPPGSRQRHPCLTQALGRSTLPRSTTRACRCRGRHGVLRGAAAVGSAWGCGAPARRRRAPLEEGERRQGLPPRAERRAREGAAGTRGTGLGGRARAREGNGHAGGEPPLGKADDARKEREQSTRNGPPTRRAPNSKSPNSTHLHSGPVGVGDPPERTAGGDRILLAESGRRRERREGGERSAGGDTPRELQGATQSFCQWAGDGSVGVRVPLPPFGRGAPVQCGAHPPRPRN